MGRRRRQWRESVYVWWTAFTVLGVVAVLTKSWRVGLLALLLWCPYEFCLIPTTCRVMTRQGYTCGEPVRGRLFACGRRHQQLKNDALWRLAGLPNPFRKLSPPRPDPNRTTGVLVVSPPVRGRLVSSDRIVLTVACVIAVAMVVGILAVVRP